jgi:recombination protein RecT
VVGVYVVAKTADGDYLTTAMSTDEINSIRDRSSAWKAWVKDKRKCPWVTDWGEMAKKTVVKRAYKYWPKTERLEQAIHHLNTDGGEGLADITVPDTARRDAWVTKAREAQTLDALTEVWKAGIAEIKEAGDRVAYAAFKAEVESRSAALRQPDPETQPETAGADQ